MSGRESNDEIVGAAGSVMVSRRTRGEDGPMGLRELEEDTESMDDPVRMYLKEMGGVELLSREGEIAIAKRIEAAKEVLIGTVYECITTIDSINKWKNELESGDKLLRDIIDLDSSKLVIPIIYE